MRKRVAITGCGVVSPAGCQIETFWTTLMSGECFIKPLRHFSYAGLKGLVGAEIDLPAGDALPAAVDENAIRGRCAELALAAARRAIDDAALPPGAMRERVGVVVGTTLGEERQIGDLNERWARDGDDAIDAGFVSRSDNHRLAALIARRHDFGGPVSLSASACASGNAALAWAFDQVATGAVDAMVAGGADTLTRSIYCGFQRMGALSQGICRPFHRARDGVSFGEGAALLVLEDLDRARARGARVYAELAGYGLSNDAYHITAPEPNGAGFVSALVRSLESTGTTREQVSYVSAHGTGTKYNDLGESRAIREVFGARVTEIPVSSIKSMIGHTNGAANAIEAVACALAIQHQAVPPTANLDDPDPECGLDCVPLVGRRVRVDTCLSLGAGFGGFNVCIVLRRAA
jgi:3-oxoacyl-(acyl-carrier-protein) synthase